MSDDVLHGAEAFAREHAATMAQRHLITTAFGYLRARLSRSDRGANALECVRVPRLVWAGVRGDAADAYPLTVALTLWYTGMRLWDDAIDGELSPDWNSVRPAEVSLTAAALIGGMAELALTKLDTTDDVRVALLGIMAQSFIAIAAGQQADVALVSAADPTSDAVVESVTGKSGESVAMCAALAARLAGAAPAAVAAYAEMGRALGTAWQLRSDCYDLFGDPRVADVAAGRRTLPVALHLESLAGEDRARFLALLERARRDSASVAAVRAALIEARVPESCAVIIDLYLHRASDALERARPFEPAATMMREFVAAARLFS